MKKIILLLIPLISVLFLSGCKLDQTAKVEEVKKYPSGIFKTINNGKSWDSKSFVRREENRVVSISDSLVYDIKFSPISDDMVVTTRNNGIYYSNNGGEQWSPLFTIGTNVRAFSFDSSDPNSFYVGYKNKLYRTTDHGESWKVIYTDIDSTVVYVKVDYTNSDIIYLFLADGRVLKTEDGKSFRVIFNFSGNSRVDIGDVVDYSYNVDSANPAGIEDVYYSDSNVSHFYVKTNSGYLYYSDTSGNSFQKVEVVGDGVIGNVRFITFYPGAANSFILASDTGIYKSFDNGYNFEKISMLTSKNKVVSAIAISPKNSDVIYYSLGNVIYMTDDGGKTWTTMPSPVSRTVSVLKIDPHNVSSLYLGSDTDVRLVESENNSNIFCQIFGILFPQFCNQSTN